jgi:2-polyprenyl-3-methyl-5-hydroxy-6-metoxy-1,4-benzoquinol methylase
MIISQETLRRLKTECDYLAVPPTEDKYSVADGHVVDQMTNEQHAIYQWIAQNIPHGTPVGDIGCGPGIGAKILLDAGLKVTGYDVSEKAEKLTTARGVPFVMDGFDVINAEDSTYQYLTSIEVIEHIKDPVPFIRELCRVGTKDMTLFVSTPNRIYHMLFHKHSDTFTWDGGKCPNPFHWREWLPYESVMIMMEHFHQIEVFAPTPDATHAHFSISDHIEDIVRYGPTLMLCKEPK